MKMQETCMPKETLTNMNINLLNIRFINGITGYGSMIQCSKDLD